MKITTHLPNEIHAITYVKNSHWIELEDHDGHKHRLNDNGLMRFECPGCGFYFFAPMNPGDTFCPLRCGEKAPIRQAWQRLQVCFVPQKESAFSMPQREQDEEDTKP